MKKAFIILIWVLNQVICLGQSDCVILRDQSTITELITIYKILPPSSKATEISRAELDLAKRASLDYIKDYNSDVRERFRKQGESKKYARRHQIKNLNKYKIQYVPYMNAKGEKEIWVNGFCSEVDEDWQRRIIYVLDGGNCYFTIRLNLTTGERLGIGTNGYT